MIEVKNLTKVHSNDTIALNDIDLVFNKGVRYGIVGETGSGKSTLLKSIGGLEQIEKGRITYNDVLVKGPFDQLIPGHPKIAYLSQDYRLPHLITVREYLFDPYESTEELAQEVYRSCHIEELLQSKTHELSGGEKQRVALAKQLMKDPEVLLLDEPFSNLDHHHKQLIKSTLVDIEKDFDMSIILVAHDPVDILSWANEIVVLRNGKIIQCDSPKSIYHNPYDEYVAGLFGPYNLISKSKWEDLCGSNFQVFDSSILVRPESFKINKDQNGGIRAVVMKVYFMGSYDELEANTNDEALLIRSGVGDYTVGDTIEISLKDY